MNNPILWVYKKELREIFRDKRVRSGAFFTPIFVMILMVTMFGVISSAVGKDAKQKYALVRSSSPIAEELLSNPQFKVTVIGSVAEGEKLIKDGKAPMAVSIDSKNPTNQVLNLYFDPKEDSSQIAIAKLQSALAPMIAAKASIALQAHNLSPQDLTPITFNQIPVKVGEGNGAGAVIVGILPYLMVLFTFTGGFSIAADMVAGEKEKNTLETLLITPVSRNQVVFGKFLAVATVCALSSLSAVVGLFLCELLHIPGSNVMFGAGIGLTLQSIAVIICSLIPLVALFAGLLVSVSTYARNVREAQTMLASLNLVILLPAVMSQVIGFTDFAHSTAINFIPVLGTAMNIRMAFQDKASWVSAGAAILTGAVLAVIALAVAVKLFSREKVLVRV